MKKMETPNQQAKAAGDSLRRMATAASKAATAISQPSFLFRFGLNGYGDLARQPVKKPSCRAALDIRWTPEYKAADERLALKLQEAEAVYAADPWRLDTNEVPKTLGTYMAMQREAGIEFNQSLEPIFDRYWPENNPAIVWG